MAETLEEAYNMDEDLIIKLNEIKDYLNKHSISYPINIPSTSIKKINDLFINNVNNEPENYIECLYYSFYYGTKNDIKLMKKYFMKLCEGDDENTKNKIKEYIQGDNILSAAYSLINIVDIKKDDNGNYTESDKEAIKETMVKFHHFLKNSGNIGTRILFTGIEYIYKSYLAYYNVKEYVKKNSMYIIPVVVIPSLMSYLYMIYK